MNLVTPDSGLLFWMVLIFGILLLLLWRFGFPVITDVVEKRTSRIEESLKMAAEAEERMRNLAREQEALIEKTRKEQAQMLKDAAEKRADIISNAREEAAAESARLLEKARTEIAAEKESALRDIRREVAGLSVKIAEKVLRKELDSDSSQLDYADRLVDEMSTKIRD